MTLQDLLKIPPQKLLESSDEELLELLKEILPKTRPTNRQAWASKAASSATVKKAKPVENTYSVDELEKLKQMVLNMNKKSAI